MPNTNGAILTVVKATSSGGPVEEETLPFNAPFDVVVEAEAGANVFNTAGAYKVQMVLTDRTTSTTVVVQNIPGNFQDGNWPTQARQLRFPVPAPGPGAEDHVFQAFAVLQVGKADPIVDFEEGQIFVITHA